MKIKSIQFLFLILLFFPCHSYSTHIVGGEINYNYLGNNNYEIHLTAYRDCFNGIPPFDNPAILGIFDSSNDLINSYSITHSTPLSINSSPNNCFPIVPPNICYEVTTYTLNVSLPPKPGGYQISYQRCCRSSTLSNVTNVQGTGATYYATIPDSIYFENSSPAFNNTPFTFICQNNPFTFDNSATDPDGDSLVYTLYTPFDGGSMSNPAPDPPSNPPYNNITWLAPYSLANLMGGVPLSIDHQTGLLSGTPNSPGVFDYGISVKEFRNGIYLGESTRDFQVNVIVNVGINEKLINDFINIYPNPFSHSTTFKTNSDLHLENAELIIFNMLGIEVGRVKSIFTTEFSFDRNNIADGIYCYKFFNDGKLMGTGKMILQ